MKAFIFDTETTGLPRKGSNADENQPWPIQVGYVLYDMVTDRVISQASHVVSPPVNCYFHPKAIAVNGLDSDFVMANGMSTKTCLDEISLVAARADMYGAYNLPFDKRILDCAAARVPGPANKFDFPAGVKGHCVMKMCQKSFGRPIKLTVAYQELFGEPLEGAHDALADTLATVKVLRRLLLDNMKDDSNAN